MKKQMLLLSLLSILFTVACAQLDKAMTGAGSAPTQEEREKKVSEFPKLNADQKQKFIKGEPWIGMAETELVAMYGNEPAKRQKKLSSRGNEEIQLWKVRVGNWKTGIQTKYYKVTMLDGKVAELQELDENVGTFDKL